MTKIEITPAYRHVKPKGFYVYIHRRATDGTPFYVGKGSNDRGWHKMASRGRFWKNIFNKNGATIEIYKDGMPEYCAFTLEKILIAKYRSLGITLANLTEGGEGVSGHTPPWARGVFCSNGMFFVSMRHATDWLRHNGFPNAHHTGINKCCQGKLVRSHGFTWWYDGDTPKEFIGSRKYWVAPVCCSNGMVFSSIVEAVSWLKINGYPRAGTSGIVACCKGRYKKAYGYVWNYVDI